MARRLDARAADFESAFLALLGEKRESAADVDAAAAAIIEQVRAGGDAALRELTRRFDRHDLALRVTDREIAAAENACAAETLAALGQAAERIEDYHLRQRPVDERHDDALGNQVGWRWTAVETAGLYVPGGLAAYPSSLLMNAIPARAAGVERLVVCVPAPDGAINPLVLAAAKLVGVHEVWRIGGAQAIAALAYGTESLKPVDKIVGPGNAYVAAAKRRVFGQVGIDMIAGPSEILVVADRDNDPAWIAADLLSQAEHDEAAQAILIADDAAFADAVVAAVEIELRDLPRQAIARASWERHGAVILVPDLLADAPALVDRLAPEHVELAVAEPQPLVQRIRHAGAIFIGRHAPEAVGDYVAGPNHVLPTSRSARFSSGLSVLDFMKRTSLIRCSPEGLSAIGPAAIRLAEAEGLQAHARSIAIRLNRR
jgi:histidinol dehydrogenase